MCSIKFLFLLSFFGYNYFVQVSRALDVTSLKSQDFHSLKNSKPFPTAKKTFKLSTLTDPRRALMQKPNFIEQARKIQRREIPFQQTFLGVPVQIENVKQTEVEAPAPNFYSKLPKLLPVKPLTKPNETEAERAERIHKSFDRLLTFVEIVGQVDNYVSSKWKNLVKTVSNFYESEDESYKISAKHIYASCPHAQ